ncbi:MAG TPA: ABC transporter permease [Alphaproteobacteria bacterium]|nr:ABC transporter permease [Alphaproteobacteria bacterium]
MVRNRVLLVLVMAGLLAALGLAYLTHAPNRLVSGEPIALLAAARGADLLALIPAIVLLLGPFLPQRPTVHVLIAISAAMLLVALFWVAGAQAALLADARAPAARTSLGAAFWTLFACAALALIDAGQRLALPAVAGSLIGFAVASAIAVLAVVGALDHLSIAKEYANRRDVFADAVMRHMVIVVAALAPTLALGFPLGVIANRRQAFAAGLFPFLNIVQTIPSIALFAMLIAPLSGLASIFPGLAALGISGIGLFPAVLALILYSLLPIVRNVAEGLAAVSPAAVDAARGMGMTRWQIFRRVELPLALPVILSGLRVTTVQAIGLTAVAALIGAGGLGAIMFQGLFANALDLVVLGAVPVIVLAVSADTLLRLLTAYAEGRPG